MLKAKHGILVIALMAILALAGCSKSDTITVGSKDYGENILLGEIFAQMIEANTDLKVNRKLNMGGTFVNFNAMRNKQVDVYPEYTGTALTATLEMDVINDPTESYNIVKDEYLRQFDIVWLEPLGFNNTYTLAVTPEIAEKYPMETFSDLAEFAPNLIFGAEHEFFDRQDGYDGLIEAYDLHFKGEPLKMVVALKYQAIGQGDMDITDAFSTDGQLRQFNLKVLEDDKGFFPPYHAVPIIRKATLDAHPEVGEVLNRLAGRLTDERMGELNYQADVEGRPTEEVAAEFLKAEGLI